MEHIGCYLRDIYLKKKSGRLIFRRGDVQKHLFFQEGVLIFAKTNQRPELLGEVLFKLGKLSEEAYSKIENYIEPKQEIEGNLVKNGLITEKDLKEGLIYQMREITLNIFPFFDAELIFQEKESSFGQEFGLKIKVPVLVEDGIRRIKYNPSLKKFMEKEVPFLKGKEFLFRLTEEETEILVMIKGDTEAEAILRSSRFSPEFFWKSLYLFYCLNLIDFKAKKEIVTEEEKAKKPAAEDSQKRIDDVLALNENIPSMDYYQILNVSPAASQAEIKKAYFHLARKYHPDLFSRDLASDIKGKIDEVFNHITKAYHTLRDDVERQDYDSRIHAPPEVDKRDVAKKAEIKFRQGKTLYNQGRYEDALIFLEEAVRLIGNKGSYFLLLALTESKIPAFRRKAEEDFLKAAKLDPWNTVGYVGLGLLYKKEGLLVKARKQFEKALRIDSEHPIAIKELGLSKKEEKKTGLKDILTMDIFGKKKKK